MLFDTPDVMNYGIFVKKAFQNLTKSEKKIADHNGLQYHNDAMKKAKQFQDI